MKASACHIELIKSGDCFQVLLKRKSKPGSGRQTAVICYYSVESSRPKSRGDDLTAILLVRAIW